jgi:hypothetical protein
LHAIVATAEPTERAQIASEIGVSPSTLRNIVSTTPPGKAVAARAAQWLAAREAPAKNRTAAKISHPPRLPEEAEPAAPNGADTGQLTEAQRERLHFLLEADPAGLHKAGVRVELARAAIAGAEIAQPMHGRLLQFLET